MASRADLVPFGERRGVVARLAWFKEHPGARRAILAVDAVGIAYGFYYYWTYDQFARTPPGLWPWVPDSPLAVLFAFAALVLYEFGRRSAALDALAFVGNVQVGLWTAFVLAAYPMGTFDGATLNGVLFFAHLGMAAHALVFVDDLRNDWRFGRRLFFLPPLGWYLLNDLLDYSYAGVEYHAGCIGTRPITVPCDVSFDPVLSNVTLGLTAFATVALLLLAAIAPPRARQGPQSSKSAR